MLDEVGSMLRSYSVHSNSTFEHLHAWNISLIFYIVFIPSMSSIGTKTFFILIHTTNSLLLVT